MRADVRPTPSALHFASTLSLDRPAPLWVALALYLATALPLCLGRAWFGYGTETDFLHTFMPEAERFLSAAPLHSQFHPPFYSVLAGSLFALVGDWLTTGLVVSLLSGAVALVASYALFSDLCGRPAALGALVGLLGSSVFLAYAAQATSDMFSLALFIGSIASALRGVRTGSRAAWLGAGVLAGLALLTRTNALTLLLLGPVPFAAPVAAGERRAGFAWLAAGMAAPLTVAAIYAAATGSNLVPNTHLSLAAWLFADPTDRLSFDAITAAGSPFDSTLEVLLHDPVRLITTYVADLKQLLVAQLRGLLASPLDLLYLPGLLLLLARHANRLTAVVMLVFLTQLLLINMVAFEPRYFLFLVPLLGAGIGSRLGQDGTPAPARRLLVGALAVCCLAGVISASGDARQSLQAQADRARELAEVLPAAQAAVPLGGLVVSRKPHLAFYLDAPPLGFPRVQTFDELRAQLGELTPRGSVYVFYGAPEQHYRPQFRALLDPAARPDWLEVVAESAPSGRWVLLRYPGVG